MTQELTNPPTTTLAHPLLAPDTTEEALVELWLSLRRGELTRATYRPIVRRFLAWTNKPLRETYLNDLVEYGAFLARQGLAPATVAKTLSCLKSLFSFAQKSGYLPLNVGAAILPPKTEEKLAERILSEEEVLRMIALTVKLRDQVLLRVLYATGCRVSEVCRLKWRDLLPRGEGTGQLYLFGKGQKGRYVLLKAGVYEQLQLLRKSEGYPSENDAVFRSQIGGGHLDQSQVNRLVKAAARRAGVALSETSAGGSRVSPHFLRHSHASHAQDRGAPVALVRDTLGHASIATANKYSHARPNASSGDYLPL